jgi:hypothetical protein
MASIYKLTNKNNGKIHMNENGNIAKMQKMAPILFYTKVYENTVLRLLSLKL